MTSFHLPGGPPPDPAYVRFLDGLRLVAAKPGMASTWRWCASEEHFYVYDPTKWGLEDKALPNTSPESALIEDLSRFPEKAWIVSEFQVPDLFGRVQADWAALLKQNPKTNLVWTPADNGVWRNAFSRVPVPPPGVKLPCMDRIETVRAFQRKGETTPEGAQKRIDAIIAECT